MSDDAAKGCPVGAGDEGYDPFEEFNRAQGIGKVENPYAEFKEKRDRCPVQQVDAKFLTGGQAKHALPGMREIFAVLSHDGVAQVLRDGETFTSTVYASSMGLVMGHTILEMDEPEHSRYRRLIQQAFSKKAIAHWETDLVRPIVNALHRRVHRPRSGGPRARAHLPLPGERDRRHARASRVGPSGVPPPRGRADQHRHRSDAWDPGFAGARALLPALDRRAPRGAARRPDQRARDAPSSTARASPTTRSSPSCACCSRPGPRRPTARRAT